MPTTIYDIRLKYTLDDKAGKGLDGLERRAQRAGNAMGGLLGTIARVGAAAAGGFGLYQAGKALIGFNASVEDTKLQIAGMLALTRKTDLEQELERADKLFANLQKRARELPGTTAEYAKFAGMITQPIMDAGLSMKDLEDLTVNSVVAAKALGEQADVAARDIDQALRGMFRSTDPFAGKVLGAIGYKGDEGRDRFRALSAQERASEVKRALTLKQWNQLAAAQGQTFNGMMSTFQDTLQQFGGKVGAPLFKVLTQELREWNAWSEKNADKLAAWGKEFGEALVDGFKFVKDVITFMIENRELLMSIGKVWLAAKVAGGVGGMLGGGAGWLSAARKGVGHDGGFSKLDAAAPAAAAGVIGWEFGRWLESKTGIGEFVMEGVARYVGVWDDAKERQEERFQEINRSMQRMDEAIKRRTDEIAGKKVTGARATQAYANKMGMSDIRSDDAAWLTGNRGGRFGNNSDFRYLVSNQMRNDLSGYGKGQAAVGATQANLAAMQTDALLAAAMASLTDEQRRSIDVEQTTQAVMSQMVNSLATMGSYYKGGFWHDKGMMTYDQVLELVRTANGLDPAKPAGTIKAPGKVNVTINRIEVKSDDPDRFAFTLVDALQDVVRNPSAAAAAIREG